MTEQRKSGGIRIAPGARIQVGEEGVEGGGEGAYIGPGAQVRLGRGNITGGDNIEVGSGGVVWITKGTETTVRMEADTGYDDDTMRY